METTIREWDLSYAKELAVILNNKKIQDNLRDGLPFPYQIADAEEFICTTLLTNKDMSKAIIVDGKLAGSIGVFRQENNHVRTAELGYFVAEPFWGKGVGTAAIQQIVSHVFDSTDIVRIFAEPFSDNLASCRVLEKAGFQLEGTLRKNALKNGQIKDMQMYAKINE